MSTHGLCRVRTMNRKLVISFDAIKLWSWWVSGGVVAHKILVTSPEAKFPFLFFGLTLRDLGLGLWTGTCEF